MRRISDHKHYLNAIVNFYAVALLVRKNFHVSVERQPAWAMIQSSGIMSLRKLTSNCFMFNNCLYESESKPHFVLPSALKTNLQ